VARLDVIADTGPLVAAANRNDPAHELARGLLARLGSAVLVLDTVLAEADHLIRRRRGGFAARALLAEAARGGLRAAFLTPELLRRAVGFDARYADLELGLVDASIMAYAERHRLPILTFDFPDFRATAPDGGHWRLVVDEALYAEAVGR
jgi:predicted nucleic acid-binding protein